MYANSSLSSPMRLIKNETKVEPSYNDTGLCHTSSIVADILWYQLIPLLTVTVYYLVIATLVYNDIKYSFPFIVL